jgi:hypothetical protein
MYTHNFKIGDKVKRIKEPFNLCKVGCIYTVAATRPGSLVLHEVEGSYDAKYFELHKPLHFNEDLFTL